MADLKSGHWRIDGNGFKGVLKLRFDGEGNVMPGCTVYDDPICGVWDRQGGTLSFLRQCAGGDLSSVQFFHGDLDKDSGELKGWFRAFQGSGGTPRQYDFDWTATFKGVPID